MKGDRDQGMEGGGDRKWSGRGTVYLEYFILHGTVGASHRKQQLIVPSDIFKSEKKGPN